MLHKVFNYDDHATFDRDDDRPRRETVFSDIVPGHVHVRRFFDLAYGPDGARHPLSVVRYVARNPYAWPGGYEMFAVTSDGAILCATCVRAEFRTILEATRDEDPGGGWQVVGWTHTGEMDAPEPGDPAETCAHCGRDALLDL